MQCIPISAVAAWMARANIPNADFWRSTAPGFTRHECGSLFNVAAARSAAVSREMIAWLRDLGPRACLITVVEHGVWPSSENLPLYYAWRRRLDAGGGGGTLDDSPAHDFLAFESDEMVSLVQMAVVFGWGITAVSGDGTAAFTMDDDGDVVAFAEDPARAARLERSVSGTPMNPGN